MLSTSKEGFLLPFTIPVVNIYINNIAVADWLDFDVEICGFGDIDSFYVTLPWQATDSPKDMLLYSGSLHSSSLVSEQVDIKIDIGYQGGDNDIKTIIEGKVDEVKWMFNKEYGETVVLVGRSYASIPFDCKESLNYINLTSTAVVRKIAQMHGLNPICPVETNSFVGTYFNNNHTTTDINTNHWDFVLLLSAKEGFVTRVKGKDWYFGPKEYLHGFAQDPIIYTWGDNILELELERSSNIAKNIVVEIMSWSKSNNKQIVARLGFNKNITDNKYVVQEFIPNLTAEKAMEIAAAKLDECSKSQLFGTLKCQYSWELDIDRRIELYGVGKGLSASYYVTSIKVTGTADDGIIANVEISNLLFQEAQEHSDETTT